MMLHKPKRHGLLAVSPLFVMGLLLLGFGMMWGGASRVPLLAVFVLTAVWAVASLRGFTLDERMRCFSRGAGHASLLLMVWIFVLAGAFAASARAMGAVDAMVSLTLAVMPSHMLLGGMFVAACLVSLSMGTSVGTIVALAPVAVGMAERMEMSVPVMAAATVGGAFFGDNLSFISDTTVVATQTQGCEMRDKFRVNFAIVFPAALLTFVVYAVMGSSAPDTETPAAAISDLPKVIPYVAVLLLALAGTNVLLALLVGTLLSGVVGMLYGSFDMQTWLSAAAEGAGGMGELIVISMLAGGVMEIVRVNGGVTYTVWLLTRRIRGQRGAELSIASLVSLTNLCTANNTVAILSVGEISKGIARRYNVEPKRAASILDTFSCFVQSMIPYGPQLLIAGGLASINPAEIAASMVYPYFMAGSAVFAIMIKRRHYS